MTKRILSLALALVLTLALFGSTVAYGVGEAVAVDLSIKTTEDLVQTIPPFPVVETTDIWHTVAPKERLYTIAAKYGTTVAKIKESNEAYFDSLTAVNKQQKTDVEVEAGAVLYIATKPVAQDLAYTVQKGETLFGIAYNYYKTMSDAAVDKIYKANAEYFKSTKGVLEAGAVLILPGAGLRNPVSQNSLDTAAGVYLVQAGDTLVGLAKKYYGDANAWGKIYEANKDCVKLINNSVMIYENQWLVIPE